MAMLVYTAAAALFLMNFVWSKDTATISLDSNWVYSGEPVVLTCSYGEDNALVFVTVDAFNRTHKEGFLWCRFPSPNTTSDGVFKGMNFSGCPSLTAGSTNVSVSMTASTFLELDFNCTALVTNKDTKQRRLMSSTTSLVVYVLPTVPKLALNKPILYEEDEARVSCESLNGKPAAALTVMVYSRNGSQLTTTGIGSASLTLPSPLLDWHNATATCTVTNHNFSSMTTKISIHINHISCKRHHEAVANNPGNTVLDCSTYISSFPPASYFWSFLPRADVAQSEILAEGPIFPLLQNLSLTIYCIAVNSIVKKFAVLAVVTEGQQLSLPPTHGLQSRCDIQSVQAVDLYIGQRKPSGNEEQLILQIIVPGIAVLLVFTCICIFRKSKHRLKVLIWLRKHGCGRLSRLVIQRQPSPKGCLLVKGKNETITMTNNDLYNDSGSQPLNSCDGNIYAEVNLCDNTPRQSAFVSEVDRPR